MPEPMKKPRIDKKHPFEDEDLSIDEYYNQHLGDFPKWAVFLSGLRTREGLTQTELGEQIGIAQYHISRMENGKRPIGKKTAKKLADFFDTDYRMFL